MRLMIVMLKADRRWIIGVIGLLVLATSHADHARAGEITVFVSKDNPTELWGYGHGASLTMRLLRVILFDIEAARNSSQTNPLSTATSMTYFTGSVALALPLTKFTPYAGVGAGLFHQRRDPDTDLGTLETRIAGVRLRLADLIVLRAEYRRFELSGNPLLFIDNRFSIGAGIAF
jgi:hypothetical protein